MITDLMIIASLIKSPFCKLMLPLVLAESDAFVFFYLNIMTTCIIQEKKRVIREKERHIIQETYNSREKESNK